VLGTSAPNYTLVGDDGAFVQGLDLAAGWLLEDRVDACLVVAAEEADWLTAEAIRLFDPRGVPAEGAGALLLTREPSGAIAELSRVTHAHGFATSVERVRAARRMRAEVTLADARAVLLDGTTGTSADPAETQAWSDWNGERRSPLRGTGMAFTASAAWLCVLAVEACRASRPAVASVVGVNRQAIAAMFIPVGE
jgi:3-oxoacyl-(acyl-carrier-protein) synthase